MIRLLVLSDNFEVLMSFRQLKVVCKYNIDYAYSSNNNEFKAKFKRDDWIRGINIKTDSSILVEKYDLIISLHFRQILPRKLIKAVRCVNVHPGFNPYNRGWYPHVFSIINGFPCGVTIHEMDTEIDNGPIIVQRKVEVEKWDTAADVYKKIMKQEIILLEEYFERIVHNQYSTIFPSKGNLNYKRDFKELCHLNLNDYDTLGNHLRTLRALSHEGYWNAFCILNGRKVYVKIELRIEDY